MELGPDLALLQEVGGIPVAVSDHYKIASRAATGKQGQAQRFSTVILTKGDIGEPIHLSSRWDWVNRELEHFRGNLVAYHVTVGGADFRVLSIYSPAWPVDPARLQDTDVTPVKLKLNPKVWVTELLWASLLDAGTQQPPWIIGGDLNSSSTFDVLWPGGPHGNQEFFDRMTALGFSECLLQGQGKLTPTFRNPRGGKIIHQLDHLFLSNVLVPQLISCRAETGWGVFERSLSDHLPIVAELRTGSPLTG